MGGKLHKGAPRRVELVAGSSWSHAGVTYQQQLVSCGKKGCDKMHGPYWYGFHRDPNDGSSRSMYVGRELPPELQRARRAFYKAHPERQQITLPLSLPGGER